MNREKPGSVAVWLAVVLVGFTVVYFGDSLARLFDFDRETKLGLMNDGELHVYNWNLYISPEVVQAFEEQTGIRVVYDVYSSNEEMLMRVRDPDAGYDIAFPSDYMVAIMMRNELLAPIDTSRLPHYSNLDPVILQKAAAYDSAHQYAVPYMWGTVGLGYNYEKTGRDLRKFDDLLDPALAGKISIIDDERFGLGAVLKGLGFSANTTNLLELNKAVEWLLKLKPSLLNVDSEKYVTDLENEDAWVGLGFNGDIAQAGETRPGIRYSVPESGTVLWIDNIVLLRAARNQAAALRFIDFLLEAENAAGISNVTRYASANLAAQTAGMDRSLLADKSVYLSAEVLASCEVLTDLGENNELYSRAWTAFQTGVTPFE